MRLNWDGPKFSCCVWSVITDVGYSAKVQSAILNNMVNRKHVAVKVVLLAREVRSDK